MSLFRFKSLVWNEVDDVFGNDNKYWHCKSGGKDLQTLLSRPSFDRPVSYSSLQMVQYGASLLPCHGRATIGTCLIVAGDSYLMSNSLATVGTDAIPIRTCCTTAPLPLTAASHASSCSRSLTSGSCSISSWHGNYLLSSHCSLGFI